MTRTWCCSARALSRVATTSRWTALYIQDGSLNASVNDSRSGVTVQGYRLFLRISRELEARLCVPPGPHAQDRPRRFLRFRRHPVYAYALATCFVLGLCFPVAAQSSTAETLEAQAYIWMQRGRADKAAEVWRKLLLSQPQHATALSELAVHAVTVGALAEAQQCLRELQEADPRDGRLAFVRAMLRGGNQVAAELREARLLSKAGRSDAALRHYWKAFGETEPTTLSGLEYYQVLAAAADGWDAAHAGLERLAELYPKAAHVQLALALHLTYVPSTRTRGIRVIAAARRHAGSK